MVVGLTGGVGAGKTTVAALFSERGVPVIDADRIARELVVPGSEALSELEAAFGAQVLRSDGSLDRAGLRQKVFADADSRSRLEAILHPKIRHRIAACLAQMTGPYRLLVAPLLIEAGWTDLVDRILLVECTEARRIERVCARDAVDASDVKRIMACQVGTAERRRWADDCVDNNGDVLAVAAQVERLHALYLCLSNDSLNG